MCVRYVCVCVCVCVCNKRGLLFVIVVQHFDNYLHTLTGTVWLVPESPAGKQFRCIQDKQIRVSDISTT